MTAFHPKRSFVAVCREKRSFCEKRRSPIKLATAEMIVVNAEASGLAVLKLDGTESSRRRG
jgi:hypothetical protein